jgi:ArsR family metal-binding transcriptional regulator
MPQLSRIIPGCTFSPASDLLTFTKDEMIVVINSSTLTIAQARDEARAKSILAWLFAELKDIEQKSGT